MEPDCVFCDIVSGEAPSEQVRDWPGTLAIVPINPVVPGHILIIPKTHVPNAIQSPRITAETMWRAAQIAGQMGECNIITSVGRAATQSVFHLHIHIVPRKENDGLLLPWSNK